jgi:polar amino acid transport system substrate-binding protein
MFSDGLISFFFKPKSRVEIRLLGRKMRRIILVLKRVVGITILGLNSLLVLNPSDASDWTTIQQRGKLLIGVKADSRPLGFQDGQGKLQGLEIDIARQLAQELFGSPEAVVLEPLKNQDRLPAIIDDRLDLVIAKVTVTPGRSRLVDFSPYYYLDGTGIITSQPTIQHLSDLTTKAIAVLNHSSTIAVIRAALPKARLVGVSSYQEAQTKLETGQVDAFAADNSLLAGWVQEFPSYHQLPERLSGDALAIVMPKGLQYEELRQKVNTAISGWRTSGWLRERIRYWKLPE